MSGVQRKPSNSRVPWTSLPLKISSNLLNPKFVGGTSSAIVILEVFEEVPVTAPQSFSQVVNGPQDRSFFPSFENPDVIGGYSRFMT